MNLKKKWWVAAALAMLTVTSGSALAEDKKYEGAPTRGEILLRGELVNAACGLAANSSPVIVEFGEITTNSLKPGVRVGQVRKDIELQDCDPKVATTATITYTPNVQDAVDPKLAGFSTGTAKGAGVGLTDSAGKDVTWGTASTTKVNIITGKTKIPFVAYLQATMASGATTPSVVPGNFQSAINFQIDYQ